MDYRSIEQRLRDTLSLQRRPIAVTFQETPPVGVAKFTGAEPSGCSFWRVAAGGRTFYFKWLIRANAIVPPVASTGPGDSAGGIL